MSDFSDRRFVAGTIVGLRAFSTDSLGRLTGVVAKQVWTPGENFAECRYADVHPYGVMTWPNMAGRGSWAAGGYTFVIDEAPPPPPAEVKPPHDVASLKCECGFYAYFDGSNEYEARATQAVVGIIEGYGHVVAGSRGFRAEKARIVALVASKAASLPLRKSWERVEHNYSPVPVFRSAKKAVADFPLSQAIITPESTDDFWTRSAS